MSELPIGWAWSTIGGACEVIQGQSPPGTSYNTDGVGLPFFQGKAEFGDLFPSVRKWTTDPKKIAENGDVLLSIRAPVGPTNLALERCVIGRGLAAIRPGRGIPARFVLYWLRYSEAKLAAGATGSTFEAVSGSRVREHPLPLPPLNEQRRIVAAIEEHLSRLDAADASLAAATGRLLGFRAAVVAHALMGRWPMVPLGEVTASQVYGTSAKANADSSGVPVLRMGNVVDGRLDFSSLKFLPADHRDVLKLELQPGDVLFNRTNSPELVGKSAVFEAHERMTFASYLIRVRLTARCDPRWAVLAINGPAGRAYVAQVRTQQVGQANVNGTKLASMPIPLPALDEQRRIVAEVEQRLSVIHAMQASIETAQRRSAVLRRAVLERAFRGELAPQDATDEPASALLERIARERPAQPTRRRRRASPVRAMPEAGTTM